MVEHSNQTIMCSVLFLGIFDYSRKPVSEQILLKERFNSFISTAIRDVPVADRIILDTSDGVAINFLGDVEDALKIAISLEDSVRRQEADSSLTLCVKIGINLGPVRLVVDVNGQPDFVGDGLNVARSIMNFSDSSQILVSRPYYDAVTRLSPQYGGMFHYLGSRTDSNIREHEIYALVQSDDNSLAGMSEDHEKVDMPASQLDRLVGRAQSELQSAATRMNVMMENLAISFWQSDPLQRAVYVGVAILFSVLFIVLSVKIFYQDEPRFMPIKIDKQPIALPKVSQVKEHNGTNSTNAGDRKTESKNSLVADGAKPKVAERKKKVKKKAETTVPQKSQTVQIENQPKKKAKETVTDKSSTVTTSTGGSKAYLSISCKEGTEIFIDGVRKGRVGSSTLNLPITPGKHSVIFSHPKAGIFPQDITIEAGKTVKLNPGFCN